MGLEKEKWGSLCAMQIEWKDDSRVDSGSVIGEVSVMGYAYEAWAAALTSWSAWWQRG